MLKYLRHLGSKCFSEIRICYFRSMGIRIGARCFISLGAHIDCRRGKIILGNRVNISHGSYILGHTGWRPLNENEMTVIEDNVRVFVNAVILPGLRIGKNSIIGAGAVVMKDVPPEAIVMGNPARVVQYQDQNGS